MKVERLESGSVTVLRLAGDIDETGVEALRLGLLGCIKDERCNVVVNLKHVNFVSYMGIGVLVERLRQVRAFGGDLRLTGVNVYLDRLLRLMGASRVFAIYENEAEAIQSFRAAA